MTAPDRPVYEQVLDIERALHLLKRSHTPCNGLAYDCVLLREHAGDCLPSTYVRTAAPVLARQVQTALALCEQVRGWTPMDSRDSGSVYSAASVDDLLDDVVRALTEVGE